MLKFFTKMAIAMILISYSVMTWGLVFLNFYEWFIQPVFTTLPNITFHQSIGIMLVVNLFNRKPFKTKEPNDNYVHDLCVNITVPWFTIILGFLIKTILM